MGDRVSSFLSACRVQDEVGRGKLVINRCRNEVFEFYVELLVCVGRVTGMDECDVMLGGDLHAWFCTTFIVSLKVWDILLSVPQHIHLYILLTSPSDFVSLRFARSQHTSHRYHLPPYPHHSLVCLTSHDRHHMYIYPCNFISLVPLRVFERTCICTSLPAPSRNPLSHLPSHRKSIIRTRIDRFIYPRTFFQIYVSNQPRLSTNTALTISTNIYIYT